MSWHNSFEFGGAPRVAIIGVPYDNGTYGLSGSAAGPLGLRWAGTVRCGEPGLSRVVDLGDIRYFPGPPLDEMLSEQTLRCAREARFGTADCPDPVCVLSAHLRIVQSARAAGVPVLSLGGDHSIAATAVTGLSHRNLGLVYVDAHPDLSSGRDGLRLLHSSWIRYADLRSPFAAIIQVAAQPEPAPAWVASRLTRIPAPELEYDTLAAAERTVRALTVADVRDVYISVDIDALDEREAPATGLPASDGLASEHLVAFLTELGRQLDVIGADVSEVAPPLSGTRCWSDEPTCVVGSSVARVLSDALLSARLRGERRTAQGSASTETLVRRYEDGHGAASYLGRRLDEN